MGNFISHHYVLNAFLREVIFFVLRKSLSALIEVMIVQFHYTLQLSSYTPKIWADQN